MNPKVLRSTLILPGNNRRFVEKAYQRGADAIILDLEDAVPAAEKEKTRGMIPEGAALAAKGGAKVLVRVNNEPGLLAADLEAVVHPAVNGIAFPKTESAEELRKLDAAVTALERARGMEPGHIRFFLMIESPRSLLRLEEIAAASPRIDVITLGPEDYCLALGVEPSVDGQEIIFALSTLVTVCKAYGIIPLGIVGSFAGFKDLEGYERAAGRARQLGCEGAFCIHPDQVGVLNRVYSADPQKVDYARRVVEAFEEGVKRGTASVSVDGKMVDLAGYNRVKRIFDRAEAIAAVENRKKEALARLG